MLPFDLPLETLIATTIYFGLTVSYLVLLPAALYFYINKRSLVASSVERVFMYFLMFFLFPGVLLLSPFLNLRPSRREV
ncbi:MAG: NAD(P)H-quinone oxidoreductase subunit L [Limnothrix sp.]